MKTRKKKRIWRTKGRKGSGPVSQFVRDRFGVSINASTKDAAVEIKNIYANLTPDESRTGSYKPQIKEILGRNFGPSLFSSKQRILKELRQLGEGSAEPPKTWMRSRVEIQLMD